MAGRTTKLPDREESFLEETNFCINFWMIPGFSWAFPSLGEIQRPINSDINSEYFFKAIRVICANIGYPLKWNMKIIYLHINDMVFRSKKNDQIFLICSWSSYLCNIKSGK